MKGLLIYTMGSLVQAISLNPLAPAVYWPGTPIPLSVSKVVSPKAAHAIGYYDLPFVCEPKQGASKTALSLDEVLRGDRMMSSDFQLRMLENDPCHILCTKQLDANEIKQAHDLIRKEYRVEWYVDGLPGATSFTTHDRTHKYYSSGFNLGELTADGRTFLYNHFTFVIKYRHSDNHDATRVILAFEVYPRSVVMTDMDLKNSSSMPTQHCHIDALQVPNASPSLALLDQGRTLATSLNVTYSYSLYFREDLDIHYGTRWDLYFYLSDSRIVWYSTLISAVICLCLSAIVATILNRTLSKVIGNGSVTQKHDLEGELDSGSGWGLIRADVFRSPDRLNLLAALTGAGLQLIITTIALIVRIKFASFGLFLLLFAGVFSGFQSSRIYKSYGGEDWLRNGFNTALGVPALCLTLLVIFNFLHWIQGSASAVPMKTLMELIGMWLGGALPLIMIGAYAGTKMLQEQQGRVSAVSRQIPAQPFYTKFWPSMLVAGALPYAAIFVELYFIAKSFQLHQDGYLAFVFRSLTLVLFVAIVASTQVTIAMVYLLLNHENHRWHWRAALYGAASAGYIFIHSIIYWFTKLRYDFVSGLIFLGYSVLLCLMYALVQGALGYFVSSIFVHKIYNSIKAD